LILDYRMPGTAAHRVQQVIRLLEQAEALSWAGIAARIILGVPLCLAAPIALTAAVGSSLLHGAIDVSRQLLFLILSLLVLPLLFWLERRSAGDFGNDLLRGTETASSYGAFELAQIKLWCIFWMELALLGPRLVLSAADQVRGTTRGDPVTRALAAGILLELLDSDGSLLIRELAMPDHTAADMVRAVKFLKTHDWIDLARRRDRLWLTSEARTKLAAAVASVMTA
jgi:hypothetical protein